MTVLLSINILFILGFLPNFALFAVHGTNQNKENTFPEDFIFATATSAYQAEGAWDEGGKSWSMWDYMVHTSPDTISNRSNADIADNSYHFYKKDIEMLKELGVKAYRFSISWPRILPTGRNDYVNPIGINHYNDLINELLANGIEPFVTMYHWDLPQSLSQQGGWLNEEIVDWFGDYARVLYQNFGDRVKHWLTLNEPYIHCTFGYGSGKHAPLISSPSKGLYECSRNHLLANARAYHIYYDEFKKSQGGTVSLVVSMDWPVAVSDSKDDAEAVQDFIAFQISFFLDPIFSDGGNYPQRVIDKVAAASRAQGLSSSRLRPFTEEQIKYIKGTSDYLCLNHYNNRMVYRNTSLNDGRFVVPSFDDDLFVGGFMDTTKKKDAPGFYSLLLHLKNTYNNPNIYVTENGMSSSTQGLDDNDRVHYVRSYLRSLLKAIYEGVQVKGYFAWCLMDVFEWNSGYSVNYGLYHVDMNDPERKRTAKKSAFVYKEIIRSRKIDCAYDPDPYQPLNTTVAVK